MASNVGSVAASLVGNTFVGKYYNVLHQSPQVVYKFYTEHSIISRAEVGANGVIDIVIGQAGIHQKIMSLDYGDFQAEIRTVDSLESLSRSVLVMVTGSLSSQGHPKRNFVQTFLLAPQEVGYFVLNDMFRYLDCDLEPLVLLANGAVEQHAPSLEPVDAQPSPKQETREFPVTSAIEADPAGQQDDAKDECEVPEAPEVVEAVENVEETSPPSVVHVSPLEEQTPSCTEEAYAEEAPKKSYASILKHRSNAPTASAFPSFPPGPTKTEHHTAPSQATQLADSPAAPSQAATLFTASPSEAADTNSATELEGDVRSIYVKNLPLNISATELEEEFKKFGFIKAGGINLCNQKAGVCFAFIEYDESSSAQSAIQASPISISGRHAYVEEKKPSPIALKALRGGFNQGRGYDSMRGGKGYVGGRGLARGSGQDFGREGRRGYSVGGAKYGSNLNIGNGYRRTNGQGGNGSSHPVKQGAGNQAGPGRGSVQE